MWIINVCRILKNPTCAAARIMRFLRSAPRHLCERRVPRINSLTPAGQRVVKSGEGPSTVPSNYSARVTRQTDGPLAPRRNFCRTVPSWRRSHLHLLPREKISDATWDRVKLACRNFAWSETPHGNYSLVLRAKWGFLCIISPQYTGASLHNVRINFNAFFYVFFY